MKNPFQRLVAVWILVALACCLCACGASTKQDRVPKEYEQQVEDAVAFVAEKWREVYAQRPEMPFNKQIRIVHTRVLVFHPSPSPAENHQKEAYDLFFKDVQMLVQFEILSDYYGTGGEYLSNVKMYDEVVFYKDGTKEVNQGSLFRYYSQQSYDYDVNWILEKVIDCGSACDQTLNLS